MMYKILTIVFVLSLTSCAIEVGGEDTPQIAQAGIYAGTITADGESAVTAIAIITSNDDVSVVNLDTKESFIGTRVDNSLTGTLYASSAVASTAEITSVSAGAISGTYTSALGGGTFALSTTGLYERTSDLSKLSGTWIDSVYTNALGLGGSTWFFNTSGSQFTVSTGSGCNGYGALTLIDETKNEYAMTMTIYDAGCVEYSGEYTGFAILSDTASAATVDSTLTLIFSNGVFGGMAQPLK